MTRPGQSPALIPTGRQRASDPGRPFTVSGKVGGVKGSASSVGPPKSEFTNTTRLTLLMTSSRATRCSLERDASYRGGVRVQRPPDVLPADRVAHQDDLLVGAISLVVFIDGVVDDVVDVAYPDVGACKAEVARVGTPLPAERIDPQQRRIPLPLLIERVDALVEGVVAPLGGWAGAIGRTRPEARVAGIVEALVEARRSAVAEQVRGEGIDSLPRERFLQAEIEIATARGGVSQVEQHRAGDGAAVDEHHGWGGTDGRLSFSYTGRTRCTWSIAGRPSNCLSGMSPSGTLKRRR